MSDIRFRNEDERRAWDGYVRAMLSIETLTTGNTATLADEMMKWRRKREQPEGKTDAVLLAEEAADRNAKTLVNPDDAAAAECLARLNEINRICDDAGMAGGVSVSRVRDMADELKKGAPAHVGIVERVNWLLGRNRWLATRLQQTDGDAAKAWQAATKEQDELARERCKLALHEQVIKSLGKALDEVVRERDEEREALYEVSIALEKAGETGGHNNADILTRINAIARQRDEARAELARLKAEPKVLAEKVEKVWSSYTPYDVARGTFVLCTDSQTARPYTRTITVTAGHGEKGGE